MSCIIMITNSWKRNDEMQKIAAKYEKRDFTVSMPSALEIKGIQQSKKYEKHSEVHKMIEDLDMLQHYLQIAYHATGYNPEMQSTINKLIITLSKLCNAMYSTLNNCKISFPKLSSLDARDKSQFLDQFITISHQLNTKSMVDKSNIAICDLDKVIDCLPKYQPQHFTLQPCKISVDKISPSSTAIEINERVIRANLGFYLENCDKILNYHKKYLENLEKTSHTQLLQLQSHYKHEKAEVRRTSDEETKRAILCKAYFQNEQSYKMLIDNIAKELPESLRRNEEMLAKKLQKNEQDYARELEKNKTEYEKQMEKNHRIFNEQYENYEKKFKETKTQLEKELAEKIQQSEMVLETKLQLNEKNLEQHLAVINQSKFRKKAKTYNAKKSKLDEDSRAQIEKHDADGEAKKETKIKIFAAYEEKEKAINDAVQQKIRADVAANEMYQIRNSTADEIKKDNDTKAKKEKDEADDFTKVKHKELEKKAKQRKQAAYQNIQEKCKRNGEKIILKQKQMSAEIERCSEITQTFYKHKERDLVRNLQSFELQVTLQAIHFQINQRRLVTNSEKILYHKSLEFCFNKVHDALSFVKAILTSIKYFWTALHDISYGSELLGSKIAKHIEKIREFSDSGDLIHCRKLQLKQRGRYEDEMNELYTNFAKLFDVCIIAANGFAPIHEFFFIHFNLTQ